MCVFFFSQSILILDKSESGTRVNATCSDFLSPVEMIHSGQEYESTLVLFSSSSSSSFWVGIRNTASQTDADRFVTLTWKAKDAIYFETLVDGKVKVFPLLS